MSTKTTIISGQSFEIATPYAAGHVLTEVEAKVLNQTRVENVRNNVAKAVKEAYDSGDETKIAEVRTAVAAYDAEYVFTAGGSRGALATVRLDPVEREARKLAKSILMGELAKRGLKFGTAPEGTSEDDWKAKMEANLSKIAAQDEVVKQAQKIVKQAEKLRNEAAVELDLA